MKVWEINTDYAYDTTNAPWNEKEPTTFICDLCLEEWPLELMEIVRGVMLCPECYEGEGE